MVVSPFVRAVFSLFLYTSIYMYACMCVVSRVFLIFFSCFSVFTIRIFNVTNECCCCSHRIRTTNIGALLSSKVKSERTAAKQWTLFNYSTWKPKTDFLFFLFTAMRLVRYFVLTIVFSFRSGHRIVISLNNNNNNNGRNATRFWVRERLCAHKLTTVSNKLAHMLQKLTKLPFVASLSCLIFNTLVSCFFFTTKTWKTCSQCNYFILISNIFRNLMFACGDQVLEL